MALLKYTALRLVIFVAVAAVLYAVGVRSLLANALFAILISGVISAVVLNRVRDQAAQSVELRVGDGGPITRMQRKVQAATTAEDAADDAERDQSSGASSDVSAALADDHSAAPVDDDSQGRVRPSD